MYNIWTQSCIITCFNIQQLPDGTNVLSVTYQPADLIAVSYCTWSHQLLTNYSCSTVCSVREFNRCQLETSGVRMTCVCIGMCTITFARAKINQKELNITIISTPTPIGVPLTLKWTSQIGSGLASQSCKLNKLLVFSKVSNLFF